MPGTMAIFDNHRVLHGRTAFSGQVKPGRPWSVGRYVAQSAFRDMSTLCGKSHIALRDHSEWHL
jgi:hypothetical protein